MKKKFFMPSWPEVLIPVLPLLGSLVSWKAGLSAACFGSLIFLVLAVTAKLAGLLLNQDQVSFLFILAAAAAVYAANIFYELPAILVLSLFLLNPVRQDKKKYSPKPAEIFLKAAGFFIALVYLTAAQEFLGGILRLSFFQRISGAFLLLLLPALFWPASRRIKGRTRNKPIFIEEMSAA